MALSFTKMQPGLGGHPLPPSSSHEVRGLGTSSSSSLGFRRSPDVDSCLTTSAAVAAVTLAGLCVSAQLQQRKRRSAGARSSIVLEAQRATYVSRANRDQQGGLDRQSQGAGPRAIRVEDTQKWNDLDDEEEWDEEDEDQEVQEPPRELSQLDWEEDYDEEDVEEEEEEPEVIDPEEVMFGRRVPFSELGIQDERLLKVLPELGFKDSTRVQAASIPMIVNQDDRRAVIIASETGSGKSLAYLIPAFEFVLQAEPRKEGSPCPTVLIITPGKELAFQVAAVAQQIADSIQGRTPEITVYNIRKAWPSKAPDILISTPNAVAQGLEPCCSEDEVSRREGLKRIRGCEMVVFDECDILFGMGTHAASMRTVLSAISASFPEKPRLVQPEAQVFYPGGVPVDFLDERTLEWIPCRAQSNIDGTFNVKLPEGRWINKVRRAKIRGPGIGLLVENGPRIVAAAATLPTWKRSRFVGMEQDNSLFNSGIGSPDWVLKRWFPNAVRIQSDWLHKRHPGIVQQNWIYITGETKAGNQRNMALRMEKMLEILKNQEKGVRTLVFAYYPSSCMAAELALRTEGIQCHGFHGGIPFEERLRALRRFAKGEVSVLVCNDLAARGIDLPGCRHVIQLEFARNSVEYLHRVGRCARAGRESKVTNLFGDGDLALKETILEAPAMGLDGELLYRWGNRGRLRRTRKKNRKAEQVYKDTRKAGREARVRFRG